MQKRNNQQDGMRLGNRPLDRTPLVVGTVRTEAGWRRVAAARRIPCDVVELRLDGFSPGASWRPGLRRLARRGIPVILTIRSAREGGQWSGSERDRQALYRSALADAAAIDIEIQARSFPILARAAHEAGRLVIGSFHDFSGTPPLSALRSIIQHGHARGADVVKIATNIQSRRDVERLLRLLKGVGSKPLCVIGMDAGHPETRLRMARAGSCLAYGYVDEAAAPGQPSAEELARALCSSRSRNRSA